MGGEGEEAALDEGVEGDEADELGFLGGDGGVVDCVGEIEGVFG